jgi:membrane protein involved in colicin uptake
MKKFLTSALAFALIGSSIASFADDHSSHGSHGQPNGMNSTEMQTMRQDMQKKMRAAKTNEERQALMAEQQKLMQGKHEQMMAMHSDGHDMSSHMTERHQMMQKHMGLMNSQMPMGAMSH